MERIFKRYGHPYAIDIAYSASQLIDYKTTEVCHIFSGMAIGTNKYLAAHQDKDYCYSMVSVFKKDAARLD